MDLILPKVTYSFDSLVKNIELTMSRATVEQTAGGASWYWKANKFARMIADETNTPLFIVAIVISATSTRNRWVWEWETRGNLKSAIIVIESVKAGLTMADYKITTFNYAKTKAHNIMLDYLAGHSDPEYFRVKYFEKSPKTWAFANNIFNPMSNDHVTIDGHATHLAVSPDVKLPLEGAPSLNARNRYEILVRAYRTVADKLGLVAWQVQAITWTVYTEQD